MRSLRRLLAALFAVLVVAGPLPANAAPPLPDPGVLRVGTEGVYQVYSYHDSADRLTGYDVEMITAIAQKIGWRVEFVETPWDSMMAALEANRFDLVANQVTFSAERAAKYELSDPYLQTGGSVLVRKDDNSIDSLDDLRGRTAAQSITSSWSGVAEKAGAKVEAVNSFTDAVNVLAAGRVDAVVNDTGVVRNYLAVNPRAPVKIAAQTPDRSQSVFAARKGAGIMPEINRGLAEIRADGTAERISQKYFGEQAEKDSKAAAGAQSTWDMVRRNLVPMAKATVTTTIPLTAISFVIGLAIALGVALARMSKRRAVRGLARAYISIIRGTPLLVQLVIIFYGLPLAGVVIDPFLAAAVAFSLNVGGYAAEIIRAAIGAVPRGQWEAATTIGMDYRTALRRIILPQAARTATPPLANTLVSLLKDTSLASAILVTELFRTAQIAAAPTYDFFVMYVVAACYYWVICQVLSLVQTRLETRFERYVAR
ncbi:Polar amino acid ABC transporter, inner membrane subunit OS=Tsukamurella paurometabola (strain ATCC 8368 / DSM / CCUG 35730 / CIP 100753 / JCM 10117 / KCTC 9821 / NBRC 16120 / NCIMB 702349 / NCTC 13040) OX=521096 GN=Tpau_0790 PE=3 SV=1 [Tsukamurella paurometabola]|uniref:Polar amino acid ABC transporter, inner membrane subunit n=1 Tax=Tsukamurella paurometabola (strain ATCC 8368 / DSM 20162 / CCUG 35730 / CIP 100753 / JCM 10117 / KCTC 9821 / NBRC 16120 / NCIMB 702349 / NCTC 13040) TaxID=521096 RepID=D5UTS2_TSUPD|nr:ABC transporter substrate-binding protein/permease [Tsukamurella paurometabola]ADG77426.1 polar amino acid ABC transporter, inner membrane subunit [Tsukamurella paurometabola DSM 20162]SUP26996.1 L-cystine transport system permease protein tcyB [Tsukamurella paurometabola]